MSTRESRVALDPRPRRRDRPRTVLSMALAILPALACGACAGGLPRDYEERLASAQNLVVIFHLGAPELPEEKEPPDLGRLSKSIGDLIRDELHQATGREVGLVVARDEAEWWDARRRNENCLLLLCEAATYPGSSTLGRAGHVAAHGVAVVANVALAVFGVGELFSGPRKKEALATLLYDPRDDAVLWSRDKTYWKGALRDPETARNKVRALLRAFARRAER